MQVNPYLLKLSSFLLILYTLLFLETELFSIHLLRLFIIRGRAIPYLSYKAPYILLLDSSP